MRAAWLLAVALAAVPAAAEDPHAAHTSAAVDVRETTVFLDVGDTSVERGDPARLAILQLGNQSQPVAGLERGLRVTYLNRTWIEVPAESLGDRDGILGVDVAFPLEGSWRVDVLDTGLTSLARMDGSAVARKDPAPAIAHADGPSHLGTHELAAFRFWANDTAGAQVQHVYTLLDVRDERGGVLYRAKLHGHTDADLGPSVAEMAFPRPGQYTLEATVFMASPYGPQHMSFDAVAIRKVVHVEGSGPATHANVTMARGSPDVILVHAFDPPVARVGHLQRVTVLATDGKGELHTHRDFAATLLDPAGRVAFRSRNLHESDGILELAFTPQTAGTYTWDGMEGVGEGPTFLATVHADDLGARPRSVKAFGAAALGQPGELGFQVKAGKAAYTGPLDVVIRDPLGVPVVRVVLQATDGVTRLTWTPAMAGVHEVQTDAGVVLLPVTAGNLTAPPGPVVPVVFPDVAAAAMRVQMPVLLATIGVGLAGGVAVNALLRRVK